MSQKKEQRNPKHIVYISFAGNQTEDTVHARQVLPQRAAVLCWIPGSLSVAPTRLKILIGHGDWRSQYTSYLALPHSCNGEAAAIECSKDGGK